MDIFSNYPFISGASEYIKRHGLEELLSSRMYESARTRGKERVLQTLSHGIEKGAWISDEMELLSYPFARILVSCLRDGYLIRRYALAEAKFAYEKMKSENKEFLMEIADEFGIEVIFDDSFKIFFADYLKFGKMKGEKWRLVSRLVDNGWVDITKNEFARMLQEAIREKIERTLPLSLPEMTCKSLQTYLEEIEKALGERMVFKSVPDEIGKANTVFFPPCISHLINDMRAGKNLAHSARFALTSFLLNIGMEEEEIVKFYVESPDFDEERTRYQVGHIASRKYTSPSCSKMETYGNCFDKNDLCKQVSHPLSYYRRKSKDENRNDVQ